MLAFLADENLDIRIVTGLIARQPDLDMVRVQEIGLSGIEDAPFLEFAAFQGRILNLRTILRQSHISGASPSRGIAQPWSRVISPRPTAATSFGTRFALSPPVRRRGKRTVIEARSARY